MTLRPALIAFGRYYAAAISLCVLSWLSTRSDWVFFPAVALLTAVSAKEAFRLARAPRAALRANLRPDGWLYRLVRGGPVLALCAAVIYAVVAGFTLAGLSAQTTVHGPVLAGLWFTPLVWALWRMRNARSMTFGKTLSDEMSEASATFTPHIKRYLTAGFAVVLFNTLAALLLGIHALADTDALPGTAESFAAQVANLFVGVEVQFSQMVRNMDPGSAGASFLVLLWRTLIALGIFWPLSKALSGIRQALDRLTGHDATHADNIQA